MKYLKTFRAMFVRFAGLFRGKQHEAEMSEELHAHLDALTARNLAAGMSAEEARYAALRAFGGVTQIAERARDERRSAWGENLIQDFRYAARQLRKTPGFTLVAVLSLALGIGANTAVFSLVDEVLLKSLPVRNPGELVLLSWWALPVPPAEQHRNADFKNGLWGGWTDEDTKLEGSYAFSLLTFDRVREHSQTLADVFGFCADSELNVMIDGHAEISRTGQYVTGNYFPALGVGASLGRTITPDDDREGAPAVAVISHGFWQRRLGGAPGAVGKTITVNRIPITIVGVTSPGFLGTLEIGDAPDISLPLAQFPNRRQLERARNHWWLRIFGRLKPGTTREQAEVELARLFRQSVDEGIAAMGSWRKETLEERYLPQLRVESGGQGLNQDRPRYVRSLATLMGLVGLVLLLACANVANLLLARGAARRKEIAVRLALGAGRGRLLRQLLAESVLLALLGGAGGVLLAAWGKDVLVAMHPLGGDGVHVVELKIDLRVLGFTFAVAAGTCVLAGLIPALRATRLDLAKEFQSGTRSTASRSTLRLRRGLMVVQVALSVVLLIAAGLFGRTLRELQRVDIGFSRDHLLLFRIDATPAGYQPAQFPALHRRLSESMTALPEVRSVGLSNSTLFDGANSRVFWLPGQPLPNRDDWPRLTVVDENFFATLGIPVVLGRAFGPRDERATKVAIINQSLARKYFGEENPIGRRFSIDHTRNDPRIEVIGVVRDTKWLNVRGTVPPTLYFPFTNDHLAAFSTKWAQMNFAVRMASEPDAVLASLRKVVREIDATLPITEVRTLDEQIERRFTEERLFAQLSSFFGGLALALACVGLYGLMSYSVLSRTGEIGIRLALGALPRRILGMILRESLRIVAAGVIAGMAVAAVAVRMVSRMLYGLSPTDPATYAGVTLLLGAVALLACLLPARRAAKVDPMVALRAE
jgi:predicted permease